jgi:Putative transmembrane protein (PGPGW)
MASKPLDVLKFIGRSSKRIAVSLVGGVFVVGGIAMLVLPGPGIIVIVIGFAILGTEYAWAAAALERTKSAAETAGRVAKDSAGKAGRAAKGGASKVARTVTRRPTTDPAAMEEPPAAPPADIDPEDADQ